MKWGLVYADLLHLCLSRCVYHAAAWYCKHLNDQKPIVMITEDEDGIKEYGSENTGVYVISTQVCFFTS